jgi:hypothetical protein
MGIIQRANLQNSKDSVPRIFGFFCLQNLPDISGKRLEALIDAGEQAMKQHLDGRGF